jgi:hypothetical protein
MKRLNPFVGLLICGFLSACAHANKEGGTFDVAPAPVTVGGVTYYPALGTTNYGAVVFTTNPPPAGARPYVTVVVTNGPSTNRLIDGHGLVATNAPIK